MLGWRPRITIPLQQNRLLRFSPMNDPAERRFDLHGKERKRCAKKAPSLARRGLGGARDESVSLLHGSRDDAHAVGDDIARGAGGAEFHLGVGGGQRVGAEQVPRIGIELLVDDDRGGRAT